MDCARPDNKMPKSLFEDNAKRIFLNLRDNHGWSQVGIRNIISIVGSRSESLGPSLSSALQTAVDFKVSEKVFIDSLLKRGSVQGLDKFLQESFMEKTKAKSAEDIFREIGKLSPSVDIEALKADFGNVFETFRNIQRFSKADILNWAQHCAEYASKHDRIAFAWRALELFFQIDIREVQILSALILYQPQKGRMAQIETGEGKTFVIAMLAVLFCLERHKVDIGKYLLT